MVPGTGRDFNCSWTGCGKSFNRKSDLCRHYRIHTNERPYHCTVKDCNKTFIQRSALTVHSRTHSGEKPHACDHEGCQKAFTDSSSLARHRRIHTGKRPYICPEPTCDRRFCRKATLTKHQHRSHLPGSLTRPSPEDGASEHSYHRQTPVTVSISDQYLLAPQPYPSHSATPNYEFYFPPSVQANLVPVHEGTPPIATQNMPFASAIPKPNNLQHAPPHHAQEQQQQYMRTMQQRYYTTPQVNYLPHKYHQPLFPDHQIPEGQPMMVGHHPNLEYKSQAQILSQAEGMPT